jgi:8-oxo-dGTP pyrophosphatase MutT (NUDIX family)
MSIQSLVLKSCTNGCCSIVIKPYKEIHKSYDFRHKFKKCKAGIFFYDPNTEKVLLVQSRGWKWGPPKGTLEDTDNSVEDCAVREVMEETGIKIDKTVLTKDNRHHIDRATYYYLEKDAVNDINIPTVEDNDASGITWINVECLQNMYDIGRINLNSHCKQLLKKILKINLTKK